MPPWASSSTPRSADWIHLASQSPRRSQLLEQLGVRHERLLPADAVQAEALEAPHAGERPRAYVQRVTLAKWQAAQAQARAQGLSMAPILCADTTVALGPDILGKPGDAADALAMLRRLSGQRHRVLTAVVVGWPDDDAPALALSASQVCFAAIEDADLAAYVASGEPLGKAGAYAIQGRAAAWVSHIVGSYSGIMGLPLYETARLLRQAGVRF